MGELAAENKKLQVPPTSGKRGLALIVIGLALGVATDRVLLTPQRATELNQSAVASSAVQQAPFKRVADRIIVPPGSMLRSQLKVAEVASHEVSRKLVLPAVV